MAGRGNSGGSWPPAFPRSLGSGKNFPLFYGSPFRRKHMILARRQQNVCLKNFYLWFKFKGLPQCWKCYQHSSEKVTRALLLPAYRVMKLVLKEVTIALLKMQPEIYWKCNQLDILRFYCSSGFFKLCHQSVFCTSRVPSYLNNHHCAKCFIYYQLLCFNSYHLFRKVPDLRFISLQLSILKVTN